MKRVLLVQPSLQPPGGGNGVAAWIIEALKRDHDVSVLVWRPVDLEAINRYYGTSLRPSDFKTLRVPPALPELIGLVPLPLSLLKTSILLRVCKQRKEQFDVIITANNEADFGRRGIQYIHYPWTFQPRPVVDLRWYHGFPAMLRAYYNLCYRISDFSFECMRQNLTIVNSEWIGKKVKERHGLRSVTLYPPVTGAFPEIPWENRENGFVCIGRIAPEKELEKVVDIIGRVRSRSRDVHLHIIGSPQDPSYHKRIVRMARENTSWILLEENVARDKLLQAVSSHRYGIHGMQEEHFGMAVAEMVRGGCIVFVPRGGGQLEIIGNDDRLIYETVEEAAEKIVRTISKPEKQHSLRAHLALRKNLFPADRFVREIREIVRVFVAGGEDGAQRGKQQ
jgi:glycosyltransferase involved in cell wall biosynthesis